MAKKRHAMSLATKEKISKALKGRKPWNTGHAMSLAMKEKISEARKGSIPWNKGKTYLCKPRKITSEELIELYVNQNLSIPQISKLKNIRYSSLHYRLKRLGIARDRSEARKLGFREGRVKSPMLDEKTRKKMSVPNIKKSIALKKLWEDPEYRKKILGRRIPSSLETKFQKIINKYELPYKYTGNGSFWIEKINPDFVNCNGEKICIEVFCNHYKLMSYDTIEQYKERRTAICKRYGWIVLFFDEFALNDEKKVVEEIIFQK